MWFFLILYKNFHAKSNSIFSTHIKIYSYHTISQTIRVKYSNVAWLHLRQVSELNYLLIIDSWMKWKQLNIDLKPTMKISFCCIPKETSTCFTPLKDRAIDKRCFQISVCKKMTYLIDIIIILWFLNWNIILLWKY